VIYYELLKPGKTVNTERYRQQMINLNQVLYEKRPEYQKKQHKVILLHDNAPSHTTKLVKETIEAFGWEILSYAAYSSDLAPSDYLICIDGTLAQQFHFLRKWLDDWFGSKEQQFFLHGIHKLSNRWKKCIAIHFARWAILRIKYFLSFSCNKCVFSIKKFQFHIYILGTYIYTHIKFVFPIHNSINPIHALSISLT